MQEVNIRSIAHITGGGFYENLPRAFGKHLDVHVKKGSWKVLPIFELIEEKGNISEHDMFNTFNMGIGMAAIVAAEDAEKAVEAFNRNGAEASVIGVITEGDHSVIIED
jgi:phosphoribosylformylglycinamidine cyclo-ligase